MQDSLDQNYASRPKRGCHFHLLAEGTANPKLAKLAEELGILPFALSLAPFNVSGSGNGILASARRSHQNLCSVAAGPGKRVLLKLPVAV